MDNIKTNTTPNNSGELDKYHGQPFLIPAEILPETVLRSPSFTITGEFVEIDGKRFYRISRWYKK